MNDCMVADAYPISRFWDNLRKVKGKKYYVTLDMNAGFWNIPLEEMSKHLTVFVTPWGLFEFNVVPFRIKNSPSEFQRAMDTCFVTILGPNVCCYIDDAVICGDTLCEVFDLLKKFLALCRKMGFSLKIDKCDCFKSEVKYSGHTVDVNGRKAHSGKM